MSSLRAALKDRGLSVNGKKPALLRRLTSALASGDSTRTAPCGGPAEPTAAATPASASSAIIGEAAPVFAIRTLLPSPHAAPTAPTACGSSPLRPLVCALSPVPGVVSPPIATPASTSPAASPRVSGPSTPCQGNALSPPFQGTTLATRLTSSSQAPIPLEMPAPSFPTPSPGATIPTGEAGGGLPTSVGHAAADGAETHAPPNPVAMETWSVSSLRAALKD